MLHLERLDSNIMLLDNAPPYAPVAQLDRVPGYEPGGREFESLRAHHINKKPLLKRRGFLFMGRRNLNPRRFDHSEAERHLEYELVCLLKAFLLLASSLTR
jgi:hypothetical protein